MKTRCSPRPYEVTMHRKSCLNANQSARKVVATVIASSPEESMRLAEQQPNYRAFKSISTREAS